VLASPLEQAAAPPRARRANAESLVMSEAPVEC
jgi:hypothetical protein